ncbi:MAG: hypothetical protein IPL46_06005 [Saprospiraceae bacterium]|nr:hypothetical protein [Saprospiraceae bacterium]
MDDKLDRSAFSHMSFEEADRSVKYWRSKTSTERLVAAYRLSLRVHGYDPDDPPAMDKCYFVKNQKVIN